ncbi:uncharacterized protein EV154DRAFT_534606, partial [Mucor mucedo]|uniref:uncharacterized protein n=1 Tax=Mucor mucedo TaxID=29922 RepID=UPI00221E72DF
MANNSVNCASYGQEGHGRRSHLDVPLNTVNLNTNVPSSLNNHDNALNNPASITVDMEVDEPEFISSHEPVQERIVRCSTCQQLGHLRKTSQNCNRVYQTINQAKQTKIMPSRHGLGRMTTMCSNCNASMWVEKRSEAGLDPGRFQLCCGL